MKIPYKKLKLSLSLLLAISLPFTAKADTDWLVYGELVLQYGVQETIQQYTSKYLPSMSDALTSQNRWSSFNYDSKLQSWGNNAEQWDSVLKLYQQGGNPGDVGSIARQLNQQFPIQNSKVANPNPNSADAKYYQLRAETALASRSASQFDYNNIQKQIEYLHKLHDQMDTTKDLKSSVDLNNRLQFENSMIQIELLRLAALSNQQQAIEAQGQSNAIINNANFSK